MNSRRAPSLTTGRGGPLSLPERPGLRTVAPMAEQRPVLDVLNLDDDVLALVSMLPDPNCTPPYRSLRDRAVERVAGLYKCSSSAAKLSASREPLFQMVIATSASRGPDAFTLAGVSITWLPATPRTAAPPIDALQMATALWQPHRPGSPFEAYLDAYAAVQRLLSRSHVPVSVPDLCARNLSPRAASAHRHVSDPES